MQMLSAARVYFAPRITSVTFAGEVDPTKPTITGWSWVTFETLNDVQSVQYRHRINGGAWSGYTNINTSPNTPGYETAHVEGTPGEDIDFELVPYPGDNGVGTPGATSSASGDIGGGGA